MSNSVKQKIAELDLVIIDSKKALNCAKDVMVMQDLRLDKQEEEIRSLKVDRDFYKSEAIKDKMRQVFITLFCSSVIWGIVIIIMITE